MPGFPRSQPELRSFVLGMSLAFIAPQRSLAASTKAPTSRSQVLRITPYEDPFGGHQAFVEFMKTSPSATPQWTDESLRAAFPPMLYERCFDPRHTRFAEVVYESPNGVTRGWMIRPLAAQGKLPVVVYNRGGLSKWGRVTHFDLATLCRVAQRGYMVLASDFRGLAEVMGKQDVDDLGHGDVHDSFYLVDALKNLYPEMDSERMAVWGFSRGTTISVMMATQNQSIRVVILQGTVADCVENSRREEFDKHVYPRVVKDWAKLPRDRQDALLAGISPSRILGQLRHKPAFALFHGGLDQRTSAEGALRFAAELVSRKFPVEFHLYPETGHVLTGRYAEYIQQVTRILDENLK